jgi:hypothetical protein
MTVNELYDLETKAWEEIQEIKRVRELETKAFIDGMEKGADLMMKKVKGFLNNKAQPKAEPNTAIKKKERDGK